MSKLNLNFTKIGEIFFNCTKIYKNVSNNYQNSNYIYKNFSKIFENLSFFVSIFSSKIFCSFFALRVKDGLEPAAELHGTDAIDLVVVGDVGLALAEPVFKLRLKLERIINSIIASPYLLYHTHYKYYQTF